MATTLGGTPLGEPTECTRSDDGGAVQKRMADGSQKIYYSGNAKYKWELRWDNRTSTQAATIDGKATVFTSQVFIPPDTSTNYNVQVEPGSYSRTLVKGAAGAILYNISFTVRQV